jgi:hypothetical protein
MNCERCYRSDFSHRINPQNANTMARMRLPLSLKIIWTMWVVVWVPFYWKYYGAQNFLWFCDLANFFILIGLWGESRLIFSWQATGLLVFQTLYTIDLLWTFISGGHVTGGTEYMFDIHVPLFLRLMSLFHIVTPPLLLWAIWKLGYDKRGWKYQTLTAWIVVPVCHFWWGQYNINWSRGLFGREQHVLPSSAYLVAYLIIVPITIYWPTHHALKWWAERSH